MATKTGQTGYDYPSMLHAATTFEECITCHPREDQQCSVECFLIRALRECLKESNINNCYDYINLQSQIWWERFGHVNPHIFAGNHVTLLKS